MGIVRLLPEAVSWREVEGEIVAIDLKRAEYFTVSNSAVPLWRLLDAGAHESDLAASLVAEYGLDQARAERDTAAFIADLRERGIVAVD